MEPPASRAAFTSSTEIFAWPGRGKGERERSWWWTKPPLHSSLDHSGFTSNTLWSTYGMETVRVPILAILASRRSALFGQSPLAAVPNQMDLDTRKFGASWVITNFPITSRASHKALSSIECGSSLPGGQRHIKWSFYFAHVLKLSRISSTLRPLCLPSRIVNLAGRTPYGSLSGENTNSSGTIQAPKNSVCSRSCSSKVKLST